MSTFLMSNGFVHGTHLMHIFIFIPALWVPKPPHPIKEFKKCRLHNFVPMKHFPYANIFVVHVFFCLFVLSKVPLQEKTGSQWLFSVQIKVWWWWWQWDIAVVRLHEKISIMCTQLFACCYSWLLTALWSKVNPVWRQQRSIRQL